MSGDTAPVRRNHAPGRHRAPSGQRWVTSLVRGSAAAAGACMVVVATLATAGHVLALAIDAHSDARSVVGFARPSGGLPWFAEPDTTMIPQQLAALPVPDADTPALAGPRVALPISSGSLRDDDVFFTGSIGGTGTGSFSMRTAAPAIRLDNPAMPESALPMPRVRPQLASLTPPDLNIRPDDTGKMAKTAIYDITAQTVYMPNGEKLEAHSGYGEFMDNPKHFKTRMRGVTPPNTYKLTMREALFHGHEAIRMTPENKEAMFGRTGILAHPYLLGPNGQSNGCVSVKDYPKFLAAFKRGEVDRMIVVFRLDRPPSFFAKGGITRAAKLL